MKEQSVSKGFAVLSAANIIVKILSFLYIPFLSGILTDPVYGIYMAANTAYVFFYVIANSGLPSAISKLVAEQVAEGNIKDAVRSFKIARSYLLVAGIILAVLFALLSGPISVIIKFPQAKLALIALAPALLLTSVSSAYRGFFQGFGDMMPTAVSQVVEQVVNTIFTLLFAYLLIDKGFDYACAGATLGTTLSVLVSTTYLIITKSRSNIYTSSSINSTVRKSYNYLSRKIVKYSVPITLSVGLTYAGNLIDTGNIMSRLIAAGIKESVASGMYAQYTKYISLMNLPIAIITSLSAAIFPAVAGAIAAQNHKLLQNRINYALKICLIVSVPSAVGLSLLSKPIYILLHFQAYELMKYGAYVLIFMSIVQIQNSILQSSGKLFQVIPNLFIGIVVKIVANYILIAIPQINIYGAAIGSALGYMVPIILNHMIIKHSLNIKLKLNRSIFSIVLSAIAMTATVLAVYLGLVALLGTNSTKYIFTLLIVIPTIGLGMLAYFISLIYTGGLSEEDLRFVPARFRKYLLIKKHS